MKIVRVFAAAGLFLMLLPPAPASAAIRTVDIPGNYYSPPTIKIHTGDTVRWNNESNARSGHSVTSNSDSAESFNSSTNCPGGLLGNDCIKQGHSYSHRFERRGTFTYHCEVHGSDVPFPNCGMCGRVIVVKNSSPTTVPSTGQPTPTGTPTTASPSPSSTSPSPSGQGSVLPDESPRASGPGGSSGTPTVAIAAIAVAVLGGSGFLVYRTMIRR